MFMSNKRKLAPRKAKTMCLDNLLDKIFYRSFKCEICREKTPLFAEDHHYQCVCCMCGAKVRFDYDE